MSMDRHLTPGAGQSPITPLPESAACSVHEGKSFCAYCKSCSQFLCQDCWDEGHEDHTLISPQKQLRSLRGEVADLLYEVRAKGKEQRQNLSNLQSTIKSGKAALPSERQELKQQQETAIAQLESQYKKVLSEAEDIFLKKKDALEKMITASYEEAQDARFKDLEDALGKIEVECTTLSELETTCLSRLNAVVGAAASSGNSDKTRDRLQADCKELSMVDVIGMLPKLKNAVKVQYTSIPSQASPSTSLVVPEHMKIYHVTLDTELETFYEQASELLMDSPLGPHAVLDPSFYDECKNLADGTTRQRPQYRVLVKPGQVQAITRYQYPFAQFTKLVSLEAGKKLARLFGGGEVLVTDNWFLRTLDGVSTHVWGRIWYNGSTHSQYWLPVDVSTMEAAGLAGYTCTSVTDYHSEQDVTNLKVEDWFRVSRNRLLRLH